jgi:hypothetical protein
MPELAPVTNAVLACISHHLPAAYADLRCTVRTPDGRLDVVYHAGADLWSVRPDTAASRRPRDGPW